MRSVRSPLQKAETSITAGKRLKSLRHLMKMSQQAWATFLGISEFTLASWESGKSPLNAKAAHRLVFALYKGGLYCSEKWLLTGKGVPPLLREDTEIEGAPSLSHFISDPRLLTLLANEVTVFKNNYPNAIVSIVIGDAMEPWLCHGDIVGGLKVTGDAILKLIGEWCIIGTAEEGVRIRLLSKDCHSGGFLLSSLNPATIVDKPVVYNPTILYAAKILWRRRPWEEESGHQ